MSPRLGPRASKVHVSLVPPWFRADSGKIYINREEISKIDQILEEKSELGSAHPAPPLNL